MIETIVTFFQDSIGFVVALSILIIVHEWGHFVTAKRLGVKVEKFSLGFGPKLFSRLHKGTEFLVCLIPLGGYVKMAGDERKECIGRPEEFYSKSPGHRALIIFNGPVINFLLAYFSFVMVFLMGFPGLSTKIGYIKEAGPAHRGGLKVGDKIVMVDSKKVYGWENLECRLEGEDPTVMRVAVHRDGEEMIKVITPTVTRKQDILGFFVNVRDIGIEPQSYSNEVGEVLEDKPAHSAGFQKGDKVIEIDGIKITSWIDIQENIKSSKKKEIMVKILRNQEEIVKTLVPEIETIKDRSGEVKEIRIIGIAPVFEFDLFQFGLMDAIFYGFEELIYITKRTYQALYGMVTGAVSAKENVGGPVLIFTVFQQAAEEGLSHWLFILGVVSASLAIFNLLPVIPLDGGHLFLLGIEKLRGRALSPKVDDLIARVGFSLIILLAVFVFYNDFERIGWIDKIKNIFS